MLNERTIRAYRKDIIDQLKAKKKANPIDKDSLFPKMSCTSIILLENEKEVLDLILEDRKDPSAPKWHWHHSLSPVI